MHMFILLTKWKQFGFFGLVPQFPALFLVTSVYPSQKTEKFVSSETLLTQIETNYTANFLTTFLVSCFLL